jgi:hypothetical protein
MKTENGRRFALNRGADAGTARIEPIDKNLIEFFKVTV